MQLIVSKKIKIIFILILLLGVCFSTISTAQSKNRILQIKTDIIKMITENRNQILYVGGTGSDNYTTIQNAIDDAINGDTVARSLQYCLQACLPLQNIGVKVRIFDRHGDMACHRADQVEILGIIRVARPPRYEHGADDLVLQHERNRYDAAYIQLLDD